MNIETVKGWFAMIWAWIRLRFQEIGEAPQLLLGWAQRSTLNLVFVAAGALLLAAGLAAIIVSYIKAIRRKKRETPFALVVYLLVCCAVLWFSRLFLLGYHQPVAETVKTGGEEAVLYDQYSLRGGKQEENAFGTVSPDWSLADDTVTWRIDEMRILQLSGLKSLSVRKSYNLRLLLHEPQHRVLMECFLSTTDQNRITRESSWLQVFVFPNMQLSKQPWYLETGESVTAESIAEYDVLSLFGKTTMEPVQTEYTVLEKEDDALLFVMNYYATYPAYEQYPALAYARQIGPDVVMGLSYGDSKRYLSNGPLDVQKFYDPLGEAEDLIYLQEPLMNLFDGIRLFRGLSAAEEKKLLPSVISNYPASIKSINLFSIPCLELVDMTSLFASIPEDGYTNASVIRFKAVGPDGEEHLYSLANGADVYQYRAAGSNFKGFGRWETLYKEGKKDPDPEMTAWIGAPVVPVEGGWLIKAGRFDEDANTRPLQFYYLTIVE